MGPGIKIDPNRMLADDPAAGLTPDRSLSRASAGCRPPTPVTPLPSDHHNRADLLAEDLRCAPPGEPNGPPGPPDEANTSEFLWGVR